MIFQLVSDRVARSREDESEAALSIAFIDVRFR
jgi:hypothetical protein